MRSITSAGVKSTLRTYPLSGNVSEGACDEPRSVLMLHRSVSRAEAVRHLLSAHGVQPPGEDSWVGPRGRVTVGATEPVEELGAVFGGDTVRGQPEASPVRWLSIRGAQ